MYWLVNQRIRSSKYWKVRLNKKWKHYFINNNNRSVYLYLKINKNIYLNIKN